MLFSSDQLEGLYSRRISPSDLDVVVGGKGFAFSLTFSGIALFRREAFYETVTARLDILGEDNERLSVSADGKFLPPDFSLTGRDVPSRLYLFIPIEDFATLRLSKPSMIRSFMRSSWIEIEWIDRAREGSMMEGFKVFF